MIFLKSIETSAKTAFPKIYWHVTEPLDDPTSISIMGVISFYARTKLDKSNLDLVKEHASKMIAIEIEGVAIELESLVQDWLEK